MFHPKQHIRPPGCLDYDETPYPWIEGSEERVEIETNNRLFEKALVSRGFYLNKFGTSMRWRGPNGVEFAEYYVRNADFSVPAETLKDILTALDGGARTPSEIYGESRVCKDG